MSQAAYVKKAKIETSSGVFSEIPATDVSLNLPGEILDDTEMKNNAGWRNRVYGLHDWSITLSAIWSVGDTALDYIYDSWAGRTVVTLQYLPDGSADSPGNGFQGDAVIESITFSGDVGGIETMDVTFQADGALAAA